jgi:uncharacterized protein YggU (UPF0235/DUF167 family)
LELHFSVPVSIEPMETAIRLSLKVHPGSSRRKIDVREDSVHLYTTSKPIEGKANNDARDMLAGYFHVPRKCVVLFRGEHSRQKIFQIEGSADELLCNLEPETCKALKKHVREV